MQESLDNSIVFNNRVPLIIINVNLNKLQSVNKYTIVDSVIII